MAIPPGTLRRVAGRFCFNLVLVLAGCRDKDNASVDDVQLALRYRPETHKAPYTPLDPESRPPDVATPPVPQDAAARDRLRAARLKELTEQYPEAYEKYGHKDPRWNLPAREALQAWVRFHTRPVYRELIETWGYYQALPYDFQVGEDQVAAWSAARRALAAGCDDPLIRFVAARLSYGECAPDYTGFPALTTLWIATADGMRVSRYPPLLRATALARAAEYLARQVFNKTTELPQSEENFNAALALVPAVARANPERNNALYHLGALLVDAGARLPNRRFLGLSRTIDKVAPAFAIEGVSRTEQLILTADNCCRMAWHTRGRGSALEVNPDNWDRFDTWITQAEEALAEARRLDPAAPDVARLMVSISTWRSEDRDQMEEWFEQALRQDPDDYRACQAKLEFLEPRWHGSEAEMLAFGRACLRTQNWEGRLPFILIEAHRRISRTYQGPPQNGLPDSEYFSRPYVWADIQAVYEPYLARHPASRYDKTCYARIAALGGHYAVASRRFDELESDYWKAAFQGPEYSVLRAKARRGAAPVPAPATKDAEKADPAAGTPAGRAP